MNPQPNPTVSAQNVSAVANGSNRPETVMKRVGLANSQRDRRRGSGARFWPLLSPSIVLFSGFVIASIEVGPEGVTGGEGKGRRRQEREPSKEHERNDR